MKTKRTPNDFADMDFNGIREYIESLGLPLFSDKTFHPMVEAMIKGITATSLDENLKLLDLVIALIDIRKAESEDDLTDRFHRADSLLSKYTLRPTISESTKSWCSAQKTRLEALSKVSESAPQGFVDITTKSKEADELFKAIGKAIGEARKNKSPNPLIGLIFFKARELKYIKRNPKPAEFEEWFGIGKEAYNTIKNYMPHPNTSKFESVIESADKVYIFEDEDKKWRRVVEKRGERFNVKLINGDD